MACDQCLIHPDHKKLEAVLLRLLDDVIVFDIEACPKINHDISTFKSLNRWLSCDSIAISKVQPLTDFRDKY